MPLVRHYSGAGPLPAKARFVQPAPQRPGADRDAFRGQVVRQHRPARGLIAAAAWIARQSCNQAPRSERRVALSVPRD
jgi:hypothetical protein